MTCMWESSRTVEGMAKGNILLRITKSSHSMKESGIMTVSMGLANLPTKQVAQTTRNVMKATLLKAKDMAKADLSSPTAQY